MSYSSMKTTEAAAYHLSPHQWTDIIKYLTADELKALRLVGNRGMHLEDPGLTCHLELRMDKAPFFLSSSAGSMHHTHNRSTLLDEAKKWLTNRSRLVIDDATAKICPHRVAYLVSNGYMNHVSQVVIFDCHAHRAIFSLLAQLPNLESLKLASHAIEQDEGVLDELECIVPSIGGLRSLKHLDIEFDCVIHGSRLSFLQNLPGLQYLRLRGFDLSDGISSMSGLRELKSLHLCHGNFYSSPSNAVQEDDLASLMNLSNVQRLHLEGFDCLSDIGLRPFSTTPTSIQHLALKHCQDLSEECLPSMGKMKHLKSLHIIHSSYDEVTVFDVECLNNLNALVGLKALSLFYCIDNIADLEALWGLASLETLNIALEDDLDEEGFEYLCQVILPIFGSLRKLRIFSEDCMGYSFRYGNLDIEYAPFAFGDVVYLD